LVIAFHAGFKTNWYHILDICSFIYDAEFDSYD
jgi:hypothetical protein